MRLAVLEHSVQRRMITEFGIFFDSPFFSQHIAFLPNTSVILRRVCGNAEKCCISMAIRNLNWSCMWILTIFITNDETPLSRRVGIVVLLVKKSCGTLLILVPAVPLLANVIKKAGDSGLLPPQERQDGVCSSTGYCDHLESEPGMQDLSLSLSFTISTKNSLNLQRIHLNRERERVEYFSSTYSLSKGLEQSGLGQAEIKSL